MADQSLHSPINPNFFQPLLPGFHTHLNIPVAFFLKHVEGRNNRNKTAKLRSDTSGKTWVVKMDGLKFTDGWEDFAVAHDLRIGDITIFRHEGEMVFHVTTLGPSCCEIQYTSSSSDDDTDVQTKIGNSSRDKRAKKNTEKKVVSSSDHSRFVANISAWSLKNDWLYLPLSFARSNGLNKMSGKKIVLLNEEGRSWNLNLKVNKSGTKTYVKSGWRRFCGANGMDQGHHYTFKLVRKSGPPVISLCRAEHRYIGESKSQPKSSSHHTCYVGSVTPSSLKKDTLYLTRKFVTANGLDKGCSEIVLKNECGRRWTLVLKHYKSHSLTFLERGWISFCQVNGMKAGDSFMFKLVGSEKTPVLSLRRAESSNHDKTPLECPDNSDNVNSLSSNTSSRDVSSHSRESKEESNEDKSIEKKKNCSRGRDSSSYSQNQFVSLTLTQFAFKTYKLNIPLGFTRANGIDKTGKITLLGQDGVKRVVDLLQDKRNGRMRLGRGWRDFCKAQGVKIGESFVLELIWDEEANPLLKFCNKVI